MTVPKIKSLLSFWSAKVFSYAGYRVARHSVMRRNVACAA